MLHTASRLHTLEAHFFSDIEARIGQLRLAGCDVIRLDAGSPDLPPAPHILEALRRSADSPGAHGYQGPRGTSVLRQAWANMYQQTYGVELDPDSEVLPLMGSKQGIFLLTQACVEPGDVVLGPDPGYMTYQRAALFAGANYYPLPLLPENHYLPEFATIPPEILSHARLLWLNYPHNPTGAVAPPEFFEEALEFARFHSLLLCHDAAYTQVTFDGYRAPSLLSIAGAKHIAVEFNSLSKSHNMAGWRAGVLIGCPPALRALQQLMANIESGHFLPVMQAATAAMTGSQAWLAERNAIYRARRDVATAGLRAMQLDCQVPQAALYVWFSAPAGHTSAEVATWFLEKAFVSLTPGNVFGRRGEGYLRLSFTQPAERIEEAIGRMQAVIGGL